MGGGKGREQETEEGRRLEGRGGGGVGRKTCPGKGERPSHKPGERGGQLPRLSAYSGVIQGFFPNELTFFFQNCPWSIHLFWLQGCLCFWAVCLFSAGQTQLLSACQGLWRDTGAQQPPRRPQSLCPEGPTALIPSTGLSESSALCQTRRRTSGP